MASYQPLKSVSRTLDVLVALNRSPLVQIKELHELTGLPKPTLVRILETLIALGFVAKDGGRAGYRVTGQVTRLSAGYHSEPVLVEVAAPWAQALTEELLWPVAVATLDVDAMVVRYSTIPESPLAHVHSTLNKRLSLVARAHGRAYLSFCTAQERRILLDMVANSPFDEDRLGRDRRYVDGFVRQIRADGFALREPTLDPTTVTLAIPIMKRSRVLATAGVTYFAKAMSQSEAIQRLFGPLEKMAAEIADAL